MPWTVERQDTDAYHTNTHDPSTLYDDYIIVPEGLAGWYSGVVAVQIAQRSSPAIGIPLIEVQYHPATSEDEPITGDFSIVAHYEMSVTATSIAWSNYAVQVPWRTYLNEGDRLLVRISQPAANARLNYNAEPYREWSPLFWGRWESA